MLHQIAAAVAVTPEIRDLARLVAEHARDLVKADRVAIFVWNKATGELRAIVAVPNGPAIPAIPADSGAVGAAFQARRPILLDDSPSAPDALDWVVSLGVRAIAAVPLISARNAVGVLAAFRFSSRPYTAEQVEILSLVATLGVAPALEAALLRNRVRDALPPGTPRLTWREGEILPLVAQGYTNREIGTLLDLSPGSVRNLMARLQRKLGAVDRTHAVVLALRHGLL